MLRKAVRLFSVPTLRTPLLSRSFSSRISNTPAQACDNGIYALQDYAVGTAINHFNRMLTMKINRGDEISVLKASIFLITQDDNKLAEQLWAKAFTKPLTNVQIVNIKKFFSENKHFDLIKPEQLEVIAALADTNESMWEMCNKLFDCLMKENIAPADELKELILENFTNVFDVAQAAEILDKKGLLTKYNVMALFEHPALIEQIASSVHSLLEPTQENFNKIVNHAISSVREPRSETMMAASFFSPRALVPELFSKDVVDIMEEKPRPKC